jgi:hypothetical protein
VIARRFLTSGEELDAPNLPDGMILYGGLTETSGEIYASAKLTTMEIMASETR